VKRGLEIPPALAAIVIVVVVVLVAGWIYSKTGPRGRVTLSAAQVQEMQQKMGQRPDQGFHPQGASMPPPTIPPTQGR